MLHAAAGPTSMLIRFIGSLRQRLGNSLMSAFDARTLLVTQPFGSLPSLLFVERVRRNTLTGWDKKSMKARYSPTSLVECPPPGHAHPPGHSSERRTLVFADQRLSLWARCQRRLFRYTHKHGASQLAVLTDERCVVGFVVSTKKDCWPGGGEQLSGAFCRNAQRSLDRILNQGRVSLLFADAYGAMRHLPNLSVGRERAATLVAERLVRHIDGRPFPAVEQHSFRSGLARRLVDFGQRSSAGARPAKAFNCLYLGTGRS